MVNAKRTCGIPLSRDVHFRVINTLCTLMQAKTGLDPILYRPTLSITAEYTGVTNVPLYRVNVWNALDLGPAYVALASRQN